MKSFGLFPDSLLALCPAISLLDCHIQTNVCGKGREERPVCLESMLQRGATGIGCCWPWELLTTTWFSHPSHGRTGTQPSSLGTAEGLSTGKDVERRDTQLLAAGEGQGPRAGGCPESLAMATSEQATSMPRVGLRGRGPSSLCPVLHKIYKVRDGR